MRTGHTMSKGTSSGYTKRGYSKSDGTQRVGTSEEWGYLKSEGAQKVYTKSGSTQRARVHK